MINGADEKTCLEFVVPDSVSESNEKKTKE